MGPFGFLKNNIYVRHGSDLIKSQWKVVKVLSKVSKRPTCERGQKMWFKEIMELEENAICLCAMQWDTIFAALQPIFLETRNPCGKVMERSGLRFPNIMFGSGLKSPHKKSFFFADYAQRHASWWIRDLWAKAISLILAYL